jgi:hypothetical protein
MEHRSGGFGGGASPKRAALLGAAAAWLLAACGPPSDPTHGISYQDAPEACAQGHTFAPLVAPRATVATGAIGRCIGCTVLNPDAVIDGDVNTYATLEAPLGVGGGAWLSVTDTAGPHKAGRRVGFFIAYEAGKIPLTVGIGQMLSVSTELNGQQQETSALDAATTPVDLQILNLPTLLPGPSDSLPQFAGITTSKDFDTVRVDFGGTLNVLNAMNVYQMCTN